MAPAETAGVETVVLHVGGLHYATEKAVVERRLGARPGVLDVDANPVAQTATVSFDPAITGAVGACPRGSRSAGYHCAGRSVPGHICDPLAADEPFAPTRDHEAAARAAEAHGHGHGGHAGMSMDAMVRDMRNRFLVAVALAIPIAAWSMLGRDVFGLDLPTPFGMDADLWQFLLSLPVVFYSSSIFFVGAVRALRAGRST